MVHCATAHDDMSSDVARQNSTLVHSSDVVAMVSPSEHVAHAVQPTLKQLTHMQQQQPI